MTSDNLPATRTEREVVKADTDSWVQQMQPIVHLSNHIAETEFVPKGLRNKPAAVAAALLYGREVGLPPMTALTQTHVIEGKPAMSAEAMRALVLAAGHDLVIEETTGALCRMTGRRRGSERWSSIEWTIDMARSAGLLSKDNWKNYPRQMLQARCTAELIRLVFPDVIHGFRAVEEFDDTDRNEDGGQSRAVGGSTTVRRRGKSTGTRGEATREQPPARPVLEGPPLPGEPGYEELAGSAAGTSVGDAEVPVQAAESATEPEDETPTLSSSADVAEEDRPGATGPREDAPPPRPVTKAQLKMIHARFSELEPATDDDTRRTLIARIVNRELQSSTHMNTQEASGVIDTLSRVQSVDELVQILDELDGMPKPPEDEPA